MMASGVRVAGAGLGVGIGGERSVIRDAAKWERRTAVAAESSSGEKTAAMSPRNHAHGGEKTRKYSRDGAWGVLAGWLCQFCDFKQTSFVSIVASCVNACDLC